ncbi:uncharacterized protein Fot_39577 [Forsythia ovata]|uniref:Regulator of MON1-CCZ1 complex N-terminal domain-containing protein n=1 Tax=Forsythia ovata TaxID=205694 RepID=A0ABD1S521_9LAMI
MKTSDEKESCRPTSVSILGNFNQRPRKFIYQVLQNQAIREEQVLLTERVSGKASASNHPCFSVSDALSHVYIQYPPLRCALAGTGSFLYDDGNKLLLGLTSDRVFSWKTAPYIPHVAPSSDPLFDGPVLSIRYSLDLKLLAIQRSNYEVQIWNKQTGDTISQKCRFESESILGFFWTDCPICDIVFVKTSGLNFKITLFG